MRRRPATHASPATTGPASDARLASAATWAPRTRISADGPARTDRRVLPSGLGT